MNTGQMKQFEKLLHVYQLPDPIMPTDAFALAAFVLDNVIRTNPGTTTDGVIRKGVLLHAMRQLDSLHAQAKDIEAQPG